MNKRIEHAGIRNRFADEYTTKTGGMNGAFGFMPRGGGGVIVEPEGEMVRIDGRLQKLVLTEIVSLNMRDTINHNFYCFDKDKNFISRGEHLGYGDFTDDNNDPVENVWYVSPIVYNAPKNSDSEQ